MQNVRNSDSSGLEIWKECTQLQKVCQQVIDLLSSFSLPEVKPRVLELTDDGPGVVQTLDLVVVLDPVQNGRKDLNT